MAKDIDYLFTFFRGDGMKQKNDPNFPETVFLAAGTPRSTDDLDEDYEGQHINYGRRNVERVSNVAIDELMESCPEQKNHSIE
jgi:hypothetical protein